MFDKTVGIEQIDDKVFRHTTIDLHPIVSLLVWAILTVTMLGVVASCDDNSGMYQGPNDKTPRYGGPK
jgi:hypothetical protein